ncbi:MAG: DUF167 family protein [Acidiferrobacteraceae bacterium]
MPGHWYRWEGTDLVLQLRVQPRSSRDAFAGVLDDRLKLRITAPPVDGAANDHLLRFLASAFGVARREVVLLQGERGKNKTVRIRHPQTIPTESGIGSRDQASPPLR